VELAQDAADVAVVDLDQLEQEVLDLDVVVAARQAQAGGRLQRGPAGGVEPAHQRTGIHSHDSPPIAEKRNSTSSAGARLRRPPSQVFQPRRGASSPRAPRAMRGTWSARS